MMIRHQADGNFCIYKNVVWFEVGERCEREKVTDLLRDLLHAQCPLLRDLLHTQY
jgi:hypothetical protein